MPRRKRASSLPLLDPDSWILLETPRHHDEEEVKSEGHADSHNDLMNFTGSRGSSSSSYGVQTDKNIGMSVAPSKEKALRRSATGLVVVHQDGRTLLHDAVMRGDIPKVKHFLQKGTPPNIPTKSELTPLHFAAVYKRMAVAQLLLEQAARVELTDDRGITALHLAAEYASSPIVSLLLQNMAKVDVMDQLENTPLHVAALKGSCPIISQLLEAEADVNAKNAHGYTPLAIAEECSGSDAVELLHLGGSGSRKSAKAAVATGLARLRESSSRISSSLTTSFTAASGRLKLRISRGERESIAGKGDSTNATSSGTGSNSLGFHIEE